MQLLLATISFSTIRRRLTENISQRTIQDFLEAALRSPLACPTEGSNQTFRENCLHQRVYKEFCCREEKLYQVANSRKNLLGFNKEIKRV